MVAEPLAEAYDQHAGPVYRFLCGFLGNKDDARDALQNVFVKLARRGVSGISDIGSYLWTAARNEATTISRRPPTPYLVPGNGQPIDPDGQHRLETRLATLPGEQREVILLHVLEGLTFQEVADRLGIPPDTAASRFRYARQKLKSMLPGEDGGSLSVEGGNPDADVKKPRKRSSHNRRAKKKHRRRRSE